jgi:type IV secretory pathway VirJ component
VSAEADATSRQFAAVINTGVTPLAADGTSLLGFYRLALADIDAARQRSPVADLPLVEVLPQHMTTDAFAILYSGDGGWRDLDQTLAGVLANDGMPVVGVDTLNYYWHEKTPEQSAEDLARVIRHYQQQWHRQQVVLIGFSFGANVLPFLYNRLPNDLKGSVVRMSLLSPERSTAFSVDPSAWLHIHRDKGKLPIAPELAKLPAQRVQCIYGQEESSDSLCVLPDSAATNVVKKPGGHHFDGNYEQLARDVTAGL